MPFPNDITCATCFAFKVFNDETGAGQCRSNPPNIVVIPAYGATPPMPMSVWPTVHASGGCLAWDGDTTDEDGGEHEIAPNVIALRRIKPEGNA